MGVPAGNNYYDFIKRNLGPFHWSKSEDFALKYEDVPPQTCRVVTCDLSLEKTGAMQQKPKFFPTCRWLVSRGERPEPLMEEEFFQETGA